LRADGALESDVRLALARLEDVRWLTAPPPRSAQVISGTFSAE
jgi:hypothetical protein